MKTCTSSSSKQTGFRGNQIHLPSRHLDVLTVYSSCKLKIRQDERQRIKLPSNVSYLYASLTIVQLLTKDKLLRTRDRIIFSCLIFLSHLLVSSSRLIFSPKYPEKFFFGYSGFPLSSKTNISKFQFDLDYCQALYHGSLARVITQALPVFDVKFAFIYSCGNKINLPLVRKLVSKYVSRLVSK